MLILHNWSTSFFHMGDQRAESWCELEGLAANLQTHDDRSEVSALFFFHPVSPQLCSAPSHSRLLDFFTLSETVTRTLGDNTVTFQQ